MQRHQIPDSMWTEGLSTTDVQLKKEQQKKNWPVQYKLSRSILDGDEPFFHFIIIVPVIKMVIYWPAKFASHRQVSFRQCTQ